MNLVAAVDEVASETQLSEGGTCALLPVACVDAIDVAVKGCAVKVFHGRRFKKSHADDYQALLKATREQMELATSRLLLFSLLDPSWKSAFVPFVRRAFSASIAWAGITDPLAISIAHHLFPGLITLQRLTQDVCVESIEIEVDSDDVTKRLESSSVTTRGRTLQTAKLLTIAYNAHRKLIFPRSPELTDSGLRPLKDARSRAIQVADVFGNFALAYAFVQLGDDSKTRVVKAQILADVFGDVLDPRCVVSVKRGTSTHGSAGELACTHATET
jgi:hypothetical protein